MSTSLTYFILKPENKLSFCQFVFCFQFNNSHFRNLKVILEIYNSAQAKVNRVSILGAYLTSTDLSDGYVTPSKLKNNSTIWEEENDMPLLQTITVNDNEEALAGATTTLSILSPPIKTQPVRILVKVQPK